MDIVNIMQEEAINEEAEVVWHQRAVCNHGFDYIHYGDPLDELPTTGYAHSASDGCNAILADIYPKEAPIE